jgi:hypothetical protein
MLDKVDTLANNGIEPAPAHDWPGAIQQLKEAIAVRGDCASKSDLHRKHEETCFDSSAIGWGTKRLMPREGLIGLRRFQLPLVWLLSAIQTCTRYVALHPAGTPCELRVSIATPAFGRTIRTCVCLADTAASASVSGGSLSRSRFGK